MTRLTNSDCSELACSRLSVVGDGESDGEKGRAREKNEGGKSSFVFSSLVCSSPTTESLEQASSEHPWIIRNPASFPDVSLFFEEQERAQRTKGR